MPILLCTLEIYIPDSHSLKEKRGVVGKTVGRLRARFNVSISELDHQDLWQRARLGAVSIGPNRIVLEQLSQQIIRESERILGSDLMDYSIEIIESEQTSKR